MSQRKLNHNVTEFAERLRRRQRNEVTECDAGGGRDGDFAALGQRVAEDQKDGWSGEQKERG